MNSAADSIRARIAREGPLRYSDAVRRALYGDGGFYASGRGAGHRRDFVTSPEVGPLFGALLAKCLDSWWNELGRPDPFLVADCGAGPGTLAVSVIASKPDCLGALRLVLVETSDALRELHRERRLPIVEPHELLGQLHSVGGRGGMGTAANDDENVSARIMSGSGPFCISVGQLPEHEFHVIFANELLDNLAFDVLELRSDGWCEVRITSTDEGFDDILVPCPSEVADIANRLVPGGLLGDRIPVLVDAQIWIANALALLTSNGRLVCIDYSATTAELACRGGAWIRTYRGHSRGFDALSDMGLRDITIDVPIDQLTPRPDVVVPQKDFLTDLGINDLVEYAENVWADHATTGNLTALKAKSVPHEAAVLMDPDGLGAFTVLQWIRR